MGKREMTGEANGLTVRVEVERDRSGRLAAALEDRHFALMQRERRAADTQAY